VSRGSPARLPHTPASRQPQQIVVLQSSPSDLAEPQVLAMMLLGLCLIGYKVGRDSSEKFK
jgi:hypothetical protein